MLILHVSKTDTLWQSTSTVYGSQAARSPAGLTGDRPYSPQEPPNSNFNLTSDKGMRCGNRMGQEREKVFTRLHTRVPAWLSEPIGHGDSCRRQARNCAPLYSAQFKSINLLDVRLEHIYQRIYNSVLAFLFFKIQGTPGKG